MRNVVAKKLKGNPNIIIPCIDLYESSPSVISELVEYTPKYTGKEFKRLVENTIGAIHQIPMKFQDDSIKKVDLKNIVAYFGRSSAGSKNKGQNLANRFKHAYYERGDSFGLVFAQTTINNSLKYERWGIHLINYLKKVDGLCISNKSLCAGGGIGSNEPGFLYMTFHLKKNKEKLALTLSDQEIKQGVKEIHEEMKGQKIPKSVIETATKSALEKANDTRHIGKNRIGKFIV